MIGDTITLLEKVYHYKDILFSKRFIGFFISFVLGLLAYCFEMHEGLLVFGCLCFVFFYNAVLPYPWEKYHLDKIKMYIQECNYDKAEELLESKYFFISSKSKIEYSFLYLEFCSVFGCDARKEFEIIDKLSSTKLLTINNEYIDFILLKTIVYRKQHNIKLLNETLDLLDPKKLNTKQLLLYTFNKSFLLETDGKIGEAKSILLSLLDNPKNKYITLYNNIARLEEMQINQKEAIRYYEKAYDLIHDTTKFIHYSVIFDNLVLYYAKLKNTEKANHWFLRYEEKIDKNNVFVYNRFLNTQVSFAREIRDRALLLDAYSKMRLFVEPNLSRDKWIAYFISKLRMSFNDNINFDENIISAKNIFNELKSQEFPKNYFALKEIFFILKQLAAINKIGPLGSFFDEVIKEMQMFISIVPRYRKSLPDMAIGEHFTWLKEEHALCKFKIMARPSKETFTLFFDGFDELRNYVSTYYNTRAVVEVELGLVDEYIAYSKDANISFQNDFKHLAVESLGKADKIIQKNKQNPIYYEAFISVAYYYLALMDDKKKAKEYLDIFHSKNIATTHFALWLRDYYVEIVNKLEEEVKL